MLPKINRIRKKKDFEKIFKNSKSFKNNVLIYRIAKNDLGINRFAFIVSKKVSKMATIRNKVRRRLSEIIRSEMKEVATSVQMKTGTDLILIALPSIETKDFPKLKEIVIDILAKAKIKDNKKNV